MSETNEVREPVRPAASPLGALRAGLALAAVLMLSGGVAVGGVLLSQHQSSPIDFMVPLVAVLSGVFLAALLLAASSALGMLARMAAPRPEEIDDVRPALERLEQSLRALNSLHNRQDAAREPAPGPLNGTGRPLQLLEQIRDLTLMDEDQRKRFAIRHWATRKRNHLEAIERDVLVGDWTAAFARLEELQIVLPDDPQVIELRERVESEQSSRLQEDLRVARGRLKQLMASSLWQQAEELAVGLQQKYAGKQEADRLVDDVRREHENWERENMERLFRDISAATERRQWRQGTLAVEEFIRRYPLDPRAEALRLDLPMLHENAGAQERKEQEEHFKDLLKRQRYDEALAVARVVIQKYPQSPTATELTKLLPRVEELSKQEAAKAATPNAAPAPAEAQV